MIQAIKFAGVTSKAGFHTLIPDAAICSPSPPEEHNNSFGDLSSITISCPDERDKSMEVRGAATRNGMLWCFAVMARLYVPILLAVSPSLRSTLLFHTVLLTLQMYNYGCSVSTISSHTISPNNHSVDSSIFH